MLNNKLLLSTLLAAFAMSPLAVAAEGWWDNAWTGRKPFTVDTAAETVKIDDPVGTQVVLIRLHQGNFPFEAVKEDGSDLRFVAADGETLLPFHIEKWDSLLYEGFVWVQVPEIAGGGQTNFWMYYGNPEAPDESGPNPAATFPEKVALAYHFAERNAPPRDSTSNANNATSAGTISEGALIASGMRLLGADPIEIPTSETLEWAGSWSFSSWIKSGTTVPNAVLLSRAVGSDLFQVGLDEGKPFARIVAGGQTVRLAAEEAIPEGRWAHIALTFEAPDSLKLFVDGREVASATGALPTMESGFFLGANPPGAPEAGRFVGEVDEMRVVQEALSPGALAFQALNQSGSEASGQLLVAGEDEGGHGGGGHNETLEHVMLFGDIASNMMFDGWIAVGVCVLMIFTGWSVAVQKFFYLNKIAKGTESFHRLWHTVSSDLTALDLDNPEAAQELASKLGKKHLQLMKDSPLYHVYHVGSEEIRNRLGGSKNKGQGLSARSLQAIRAALDAGLVREHHRLNKGIVLLTISIAGGPYVGLLGTVVGVMITFALIAKTGEVEVNSIAPGIASALLATVAGLVVAIPALFIYSYLNSRIKETITGMQVFIDEFVAKVAEFYPPPGEANLVPHTRLPKGAVEAASRETGDDSDDDSGGEDGTAKPQHASTKA